MTRQTDLFGDAPDAPDAPDEPTPPLPPGFRYQPALVSPAEQDALLAEVRTLPFRAFEFHGYTGKRRVVSFGWHYDFAAGRLREADEIPAFLLALRPAAAAFAGLDPEALRHVLVTEYGAGAAIGWHRDKAVFGDVVGVSLLADCVFRLRRAVGDRWERASLVAAARSAYLLSGPARTEWEHSIPPVDALRYSITFRTLRER
jgi:alkylated DNA repair dioxygenase AlkB